MPNSVHFVVMTDEPSSDSAHLTLACHLTCHYAAQGLKIFLLADDESMAQQLDDALFSLPLELFTPHAQSQFAPRYGCSTLIGHHEPKNFVPLLINLSAKGPSNTVKCRHIIDLVPFDPLLKQQARDRYRQYQGYGLPPTTGSESDLPAFN